MKHFRFLYEWSGRHYETTMPGRNAMQAMMFAEFQIMPGARIFGIEVTA